MKKLLSVLLVLVFCFSACSQQAQTSEEPQEEQSVTAQKSADVTLDGYWSDGDRLLTIEGDKILIEFWGDSYVGTVDTDAKTITFHNTDLDNDSNVVGDTVYSYDFIGGNLVLTTESEHNRISWDETLTFKSYDPDATADSDESTEDKSE